MNKKSTDTGKEAIGIGTPRRRPSKKVLITLAVSVLFVVVAIFGYSLWQSRFKETKKMDPDSAAQVDRTLRSADAFSGDSLMWTSLMGNAALYAAQHDGCDRARSIIGQVEAKKLNDPSMLSDIKKEVSDVCH